MSSPRASIQRDKQTAISHSAVGSSRSSRYILLSATLAGLGVLIAGFNLLRSPAHPPAPSLNPPASALSTAHETRLPRTLAPSGDGFDVSGSQADQHSSPELADIKLGGYRVMGGTSTSHSTVK